MSVSNDKLVATYHCLQLVATYHRLQVVATGHIDEVVAICQHWHMLSLTK